MMVLLYLPFLAVFAGAYDSPIPITSADGEDSCHARPVEAQQLLQHVAYRATGTAPAYMVAKNTVSSKVRFVFFAGVEGTGHHFWKETF